MLAYTLPIGDLNAIGLALPRGLAAQAWQTAAILLVRPARKSRFQYWRAEARDDGGVTRRAGSCLRAAGAFRGR